MVEPCKTIVQLFKTQFFVAKKSFCSSRRAALIKFDLDSFIHVVSTKKNEFQNLRKNVLNISANSEILYIFNMPILILNFTINISNYREEAQPLIVEIHPQTQQK
jgi:hypothetical protein